MPAPGAPGNLALDPDPRPRPAGATPTSLLLLALAVAVAAPAAAQEEADAGTPRPAAPSPGFSELITVTATGGEHPVAEIPLPITVITREQIDNSQEESVVELLRRTPGLTVLRTGGEGSLASVFVRGTEADQTLALFDGVRLNSPYFSGYDWSAQSTAGLERIEVARGPYSALWGADAIGGVINVLPEQGGDRLGAQLFAEVGEDEWRRAEGSVGWGDDGFDVYAAVFDRDGEGELANSDFSNRQLLLDAGYGTANGSRVAVLYQDLESALGIPLIDPLTPSPSRRQRDDQQLFALPLHLQASTRWNLELVPSLVERRLTFRDPDDPFGFTAGDTRADTLQARLASHHGFDGGRGGGHAFSWGGEWREDQVDDSSNFGRNLDGETSQVAGFFLQDVWTGERLTLLGGLRWDDAEEWGSEVSPRLSLGWQVATGVELKGGYGQAFRQPSVGELYFPFSGNPQLDAERSESAELGVGWQLGGHRVDAFLFATDIDHQIDFDFATFTFVNRSEAEIRGAELAWFAPLPGKVESWLRGTWLDTEDLDGLPLLRRPEWSASWSLAGSPWRRLRGDLSLFWVGSRADLDPVSFGRTELGSHLSADLAVAFEVRGGLEVTARVQNLADESYEEVAGYPAPGRRLSGGLRWSR